MGHIETNIIQNFVFDNNNPKIFIETGTFKGGTPQFMLDDGSFEYWKKIYTMEINPEMCKIASKRYSLYEKFGDSNLFDLP